MGSAAERKGRGWVTWRVSGLRQELEEPDGEVLVRAARSIGVDPAAVRGQRFARRSVDARVSRSWRRFGTRGATRSP